MEKGAYTELSVRSDVLTPDEVTSILGISCDRGYVKGTIRPPRKTGRFRYAHHGWVLKSRLPREAPLEDHVNDLLERLAPIKGKVRQVSHEAVVTFSCVVHFTDDDMPALVFDAAVIAAIADMGAGFWIDLYRIP